MNLTIDIGNTMTKAAVFDGDKLLVRKNVKKIKTEYFKVLVKEYKIKAAILSSVAEHDGELEEILREKLFFVSLDEHTPLPVKNRYKTPATLGKDRIAAVAGASSLYPGKDILVIDAGTCVTYDFINRKNEYFGGSISPGISLRLKALHNYTGRLPLVKQEETSEVIGRNTKDAILSGVEFGLAYEMEGFINYYQSIYPDIKVLITGGKSRLFEKRIKNQIFAVPNLVLIGLNKILEHNAR